MALLPIRRHPDAVLRATARPVALFDATLSQLAADMIETMYHATGRGLAAPQVGLPLRLFVTDVRWREGDPEPKVFVNPELVSASDETVLREEGCLSIPDTPCRVRRPARVVLKWQDLQGAGHEAAFEGIEATCVQHELDHLDGVLCIDRHEEENLA
ncbi:peptide deformylase [Limimaricola pyoseonensis]|uniref:Peptide deformylase n=1 Tax=Limimaricola pyoseonensis TaxID=521013 RepID=A0A1G7E7G5_9RHOB|nr:peptide deformylase [Limimaricola pyoseonensis]SDE59593.1 peptide deformylase [Limimaricola pyoseonensis]